MAEIRRVEPHERERAIDLMVPVFAEDPTYKFMFEGCSDYLQAVRDNIQGYCGSSLEDGTMWTINDFDGLSAWLKPGISNYGAAIDASMKKWCPEDRYEEVQRISDESADFQPDFPCWCLEVIVVDATLHGQGTGATLIEHTLKMVDAENMPAFLESTNPKNVSFYERYGFEALAKIKLGGTYMITPMLRPAKG